jgi:TolB-like protein/Flp pilus assembly protein TadD
MDVIGGDSTPQHDNSCDTDRGTQQTTVFISYSREDQARILPIIRLIEQAGFAVWWDGLLAGGERFSQTTQAALDRAQAVVVLWSTTSIHSHWVHDEATRGRDRRILVPLSLDGSLPPLGFGQFQAIDLSHAKMTPKDVGIQRMLRAIEMLHGAQVPAIDRTVALASTSTNRRTVMIGGAAAIALGGGAFAYWSGLLDGGRNGLNRVAILPFNNIGDDPKHAYIADGLTNEIRAMLAQNGALEVIGQASSEAFVRGKEDPVSFAKKLRAGFMVDGAVQIAGDILRVTIDLIDGKTGVGQAPRTFEKPMGDILSAQRAIGSAIAAELSGKIGAKGSTKSDVGGTTNVIAYDHYLRGKDLHANAKNEAEQLQAVKQFDAAIAVDPNFAAAHAARARSLAALSGQYGSATEIRLYREAAIASARTAVKLAPRYAEAHSALALMLFQGNFDAKGAREPFDLSRKLGDGVAPVMARFAGYCAATGRERDALSSVQRALQLDPLNALVHRISGMVNYAARQYPAAIAALRQALSINPNLPDTHSRIGLALLAQDKVPEALKAFEADSHKWSKQAGIAIAQNRIGNMTAAKAALAALTADTDTVSFYQQGQVFAQWGEVDRALAALWQAYEQRDAGLTEIRVDPMLDPLIKQPRYIDLLKAMGLD